jgi:hypothetical protein
MLVINSRRIGKLGSRCPVADGAAGQALANLGLIQRADGLQPEQLTTAEEAFLIADDLAALVDTLAPLLGLSVSDVFVPFFDSRGAEL